MKLLDRLMRRIQPAATPEEPAVLRKDLKPGTLFRYRFHGYDSPFVMAVPPRHPDMPAVALAYPDLHDSGDSNGPGPGDLLNSVEVLWEPPSQPAS